MGISHAPGGEMYPLIVSVFLLAVTMIMPTFLVLPHAVELQRFRHIAANFCVYREAVSQYLNSHAGIAAIPPEDIPLPPGYVMIGNWQNHMAGSYCYVFGDAVSADVISHIRNRLGNSVLVGQNINGVIFPSGIVLPVGHGVPNGSIVSLVSVQ